MSQVDWHRELTYQVGETCLLCVSLQHAPCLILIQVPGKDFRDGHPVVYLYPFLEYRRGSLYHPFLYHPFYPFYCRLDHSPFCHSPVCLHSMG